MQALEPNIKELRKEFEKTINNMLFSSEYSSYVFYAHLVSQCSIIMDCSLPAAAGVSFNINHYNLYINPLEFNEHSLKIKAGILKHEMLHILLNHIDRTEHRDKENFNIASDIAINQMVGKDNLFKGVYFHDDPFEPALPVNLSAEQYYELLPKQQKQDCPDCQGSGQSTDKDGNEQECKSCSGSGTKGKEVGTHQKWEESQGDNDLRKDITRRMIEKSIEKSRGNLPAEWETFLEIFKSPVQVSWRRALKNITSNKKANTRRTVMRSDRRFPAREDLKGRTKDRTFDLVVIVDVSGSMSDNEILTGLNEIKEICRMNNTTLKMIQVDTQVHSIEEFKRNSTKFKRNAQGGTYIYPAISYIREKKIKYDAIIIITDGGIEDVSKWEVPVKERVIFLNTASKIPGIDSTNYKEYNLITQR